MKKTIALLLVCLSLFLLLTACGEKEKPKLSELSDEDMMAYLKESGITSQDDICGEKLHEAAEKLRTTVKIYEDDPKQAYFIAYALIGTSMGSSCNMKLVAAVNGYYGLDNFGNPIGEAEKYDSYAEYRQKMFEEFLSPQTENVKTGD